MNVVSIDPGEVHCGVVWWFTEDSCVDIFEYLPYDLFKAVRLSMELGPKIDVMVVESFHLYPWKSAEQGFSQLKTVETIGVLRYLAFQYEIEFVEQPALIKKPAAGQMRGRGVTNEAVAQHKGGHCSDAYLHGWYYLNKPKQGEENGK